MVNPLKKIFQHLSAHFLHKISIRLSTFLIYFQQMVNPLKKYFSTFQRISYIKSAYDYALFLQISALVKISISAASAPFLHKLNNFLKGFEQLLSAFLARYLEIRWQSYDFYKKFSRICWIKWINCRISWTTFFNNFLKKTSHKVYHSLFGDGDNVLLDLV